MTRSRARVGQGLFLAQALLSAYLVFHLFAVIVAPNVQSTAGTVIVDRLNPYLRFFEFTNCWSFFAPNPGPPPFFLEWELEGADSQILERGSWPEPDSPFFLRERQNRRVTAADFFLTSDVKTEHAMIPYLCHRKPGVRSVRLWTTLYSVPTTAEVASGKKKLMDPNEITRRFISHSFCEGVSP